MTVAAEVSEPDAAALLHRAPRGRGRPRNADTDAEILRAARAILAAKGFEAMTFEAISQATGIARATIYRRWPSKAHLASEIAHGGGSRLIAAAGEAGLRRRVEAVVRQVYDLYARPEVAAASVGLIIAYQADPALRPQLHAGAEAAARADLHEIVEAGRRAGEVRADVDADALFDLVIGALIFRAVFSSLPLKATIAREISAIVLDGVAKA